MKHPNAATASAATGPAVLIVWLAGHFGLDVPAEVGAVAAGLLISAGLLVGRAGVRGILSRLWRGQA